ncbi:MAG: DUF4956 domain-containing protein [Clostridia bacterium]|nr:DUF4956 domain-containing protein [Clostridia bacterium]
MNEALFRGLFDAEGARVISLWDFSLCLFAALVLGLGIALSYCYRSVHSQGFATTLALLPGAVCVVILLVNGNVGTGVAVAGAFSLVRFRSVPGTAREICALFLAMGTGLLCGMGYPAFALLFTLVMCLCLLLYQRVGLGKKRKTEKLLQITVPEDLHYTEIFDDIFPEYTLSHSLIQVKSCAMGSLFKLRYRIELKDPQKEKELLDRLRCRNGNLEISLSLCENSEDSL